MAIPPLTVHKLYAAAAAGLRDSNFRGARFVRLAGGGVCADCASLPLEASFLGLRRSPFAAAAAVGGLFSLLSGGVVLVSVGVGLLAGLLDAVWNFGAGF